MGLEISNSIVLTIGGEKLWGIENGISGRSSRKNPEWCRKLYNFYPILGSPKPLGTKVYTTIIQYPGKYNRASGYVAKVINE